MSDETRTARQLVHEALDGQCGDGWVARSGGHDRRCDRLTAAIEARDEAWNRNINQNDREWEARLAALMAETKRLRSGLADVVRMSYPGRGFTMQMIRRRAIGATMAERFCHCPQASEPSPCDSWAEGGICASEDSSDRSAAPGPLVKETPK